jgi:Alcohol dehydrogenase transcription factor Myb/SANT-like
VGLLLLPYLMTINRKFSVICEFTMAERVDWTDDKVSKLIELYEQEPCLYQTTCSDYHNRHTKKAAIARIAGQLNVAGRRI